ncbi:hypothetical protein FHS48_003650 [Novispirillum itersonii]|uniref:Uncharacterized protein n=1 Tax=Novispirillum itersonii TaxID=189 RepID=A0A7W9ZIR7_NOVIT|nr:hypothetical protein [Novispirillum itersonii]
MKADDYSVGLLSVFHIMELTVAGQASFFTETVI